jgi:hypothetical protein
VLHLAVEQVGDGLEAAVRMVGRTLGLARAVLDRAHLVEHEERVGRAEVGARLRERPVHGEACALERGGRTDDRLHRPSGAVRLREHGQRREVDGCDGGHGDLRRFRVETGQDLRT